MFYSLVDHKGVYHETKLDDLFNKKEKGFFIELGAHDGLTQSNTAFLEKTRNWTGILIEPSVSNYQKCIKNREKSIVVNCACVSNEYKEEFVKGDFSENSLMSSVGGKRRRRGNKCNVKAKTLENILDEHLKENNIDFLSLDTEGYELNILKGLNLQKYKPSYMLIEIYNFDYENILKFLNEFDYELVCNFSGYNKKDNPGWDGTHNDYLFKYKLY